MQGRVGSSVPKDRRQLMMIRMSCFEHRTLGGSGYRNILSSAEVDLHMMCQVHGNILLDSCMITESISS